MRPVGLGFAFDLNGLGFLVKREDLHFQFKACLIFDIGPGDGPRQKGTDKTADFIGRPRPVDLGIQLIEFRKISLFGVVLRGKDGRISDIGIENCLQIVRGQRKGFLIKGRGGFGGGNVKWNLGNDRAVVGEGIDLEKADGRFCFSIYNLPGAGGGAAVKRQGGGMNIDDFKRRNINHFLTKKRRAVGDNQD